MSDNSLSMGLRSSYKLGACKMMPAVPTTSARKPFQFELVLRTKEGHMDAGWRQ